MPWAAVLVGSMRRALATSEAEDESLSSLRSRRARTR